MGRTERAHRYAVILAGGAGTRFWPQSRRRRPKQFLAVDGGRTLLQETARRLRGVVPADHLYVIAPRQLAVLVRRQLPDLPRRNLLVEPAARGTAPCLAWAAAHLARRDPAAVMAAFPADHVIRDVAGFRRCLRAAFEAAAGSEALVTIGIAPTRAETGYGYIEMARRGRRPAAGGRAAAVPVARFLEKPDRRTAERFVAARRHLWNAGMFVWRIGVFQAALARHAPHIARVMARARRDAAAGRRAYARLPSEPIDTALMERAERVAVVRATFDWNDVGSWAALPAVWGTDAAGNAARGAALLIDCRDTVVCGERRLVAVLGARDLIVVDSPDALLVCPRDRAQDVRRVVDALARGRYRRLR